eukprot:scaffold2355_cov382-Prasinococcus_capsulatus_cf.AAC.17
MATSAARVASLEEATLGLDLLDAWVSPEPPAPLGDDEVSGLSANQIDKPPLCPASYFHEQNNYATPFWQFEAYGSAATESALSHGDDLADGMGRSTPDMHFDVVVPFYEKELCGLRLLLTSLFLHDVTGIISRVFLQWNSVSKLEDYELQIHETLKVLGENVTRVAIGYEPCVVAGSDLNGIPPRCCRPAAAAPT